MIELHSVKKQYVDHLQPILVLNALNLQVAAGQSVSIIGESGSGKTTLLSILAGLERIDSGGIRIFDKDFAVLNSDELSQFRLEHVGIIYQQFHLIPHLTCWENVALPLQILGQKDAAKKAEQMLAAVQLQHRLKHFPAQLSGGECQRVAIARALVSKPKLVLADEPTGNLDAKTGKKVMDLMFELIKASHTTLILVTHSFDLAKRCDLIYELAGGKLQSFESPSYDVG